MGIGTTAEEWPGKKCPPGAGAEAGCTVVVMLPGSKCNLLVFHLAFQSGCPIRPDGLGRSEKAPAILITTMTGAFCGRSYSAGTIGIVRTPLAVCDITCRLCPPVKALLTGVAWLITEPRIA